MQLLFTMLKQYIIKKFINIIQLKIYKHYITKKIYKHNIPGLLQ